MRVTQRTAIVALLLGLLGVSSGCLALAAGGAAGGAASYAYGDTEGTFDTGPERIIEAARQVYQSLGITVVEKQAYASQVQLQGKTSNGESVKVTVEKRNEATKLWVRVGFFGDNALSQQIYSRIQSRISPTTDAEG